MCSNLIDNTPIKKVNKKYSKQCNLKPDLLFAFLNRIGILPIIKPIKQKLVGIGYVANKNFNNLLTSNTPIIPPSAIGNRKEKFLLNERNNEYYQQRRRIFL